MMFDIGRCSFCGNSTYDYGNNFQGGSVQYYNEEKAREKQRKEDQRRIEEERQLMEILEKNHIEKKYNYSKWKIPLIQYRQNVWCTSYFFRKHAFV